MAQTACREVGLPTWGANPRFFHAPCAGRQERCFGLSMAPRPASVGESSADKAVDEASLSQQPHDAAARPASGKEHRVGQADLVRFRSALTVLCVRGIQTSVAMADEDVATKAPESDAQEDVKPAEDIGGIPGDTTPDQSAATMGVS